VIDKWGTTAHQARGIQGFVNVAGLPKAKVTTGPGVYVVLWPGEVEPAFLPVSAAGHFKGRDPSVHVERLRTKWIATSPVTSIGKATAGRGGRRGLRQRLDEYRRIGAGEAVAHWGGRFVWQLERSVDLIVAWQETPSEDAGAVETHMLEEFLSDHGRLPFANLRR
jgi:hypothetical protein